MGKNSLKDPWDKIKYTDIHIKGVSKGEEGEKGLKKMFLEIIAENFTNKGNEIVYQVYKAQIPR